jgi:Family of unknown function (DUF5701)
MMVALVNTENMKTLQKEFDRQLETLAQKDYPTLLGMTERKFKNELEPLKAKLSEVSTIKVDLEQGKLFFVIVVQSELLKVDETMTRLDFHGKPGIVSMNPLKPEDFRTINKITLPSGLAYLLTDIDRGKAFLNVIPETVLKTILQENRSPLTINEGIAVLTHYPEFLKKNNCFSLLASRHTDQRVPALWISEKRPKLGWCWDRNPHTWLGSASCGARVSLHAV